MTAPYGAVSTSHHLATEAGVTAVSDFSDA